MLLLSKLARYYLPLRDFLYILQLEEYNLQRYYKQVAQRIFKRGFEKHGKLKSTQRIQITYLCAIIIIGGSAVATFLYSSTFFVFFLLSVPILTPFAIAISSLFLSPILLLISQNTLRKAHTYFYKNYPDTKIIAITGSFGKTTTKYLLKSLLEHTHDIDIIPDNINTAAGIANFILDKKIQAMPKFLIVEMGAYIQGDIQTTTHLLPPDIVIITALGDQHIERFGNLKNLVHAKNEIFTNSKIGALKYTTSNSIGLLEKYKLHTNDIIGVSTPSSAESNIILASKVAEDLGVSKAFISDALLTFVEPSRRNEHYIRDNVTIIDNSYNISPQTAEKMLKDAHTSASKIGKKVVVLTAGIAEQGKDTLRANKDFAVLLNTYASRVLLNPSIYMRSIRDTITVPYTIQPSSSDVIQNVSKYIDGASEVLLYFPEHTDLSYR